MATTAPNTPHHSRTERTGLDVMTRQLHESTQMFTALRLKYLYSDAITDRNVPEISCSDVSADSSIYIAGMIAEIPHPPLSTWLSLLYGLYPEENTHCRLMRPRASSNARRLTSGTIRILSRNLYNVPRIHTLDTLTRFCAFC